MTIKELRAKRGKLVADMRALLEAAKTEKRGLNAEEQAKYDAMFAEQEGVQKQISQEERQADLERDDAERRLREKDGEDDDADDDEHRSDPGKDAEHGKLPGWALRMKDKRGNIPDFVLSLAQRTGGIATPEYRKAFGAFLGSGFGSLSPDNKRALAAGAGSEGGYLIAPPAFVAELIKAVDNMLWIRQLARQVPITGSDEIGAPSLDADPDDFDWTTELETGNADSTMAFGKRKMEAHPLAKRIKVSRKLLRLSALGAEALVRERLAYKFAVTLEKAYLTGNGVDKPLGLFTASTDGISTGRDVSTGNDTTSFTFDGLIEAKYSVKGAYWGAANWLFHRTVMKDVSKLKDNDGQYLWRPSVREGEPDTILGHPVRVSEYTPNTMTTGQYFGLFGDFSRYWFLDSLNLEIQRLDELYAETNQVGFIGRYEGDGAPVLEEAFARLKLA